MIKVGGWSWLPRHLYTNLKSKTETKTNKNELHDFYLNLLKKKSGYSNFCLFSIWWLISSDIQIQLYMIWIIFMFMTEAGQRGNRWASPVWMTVLGSMKWASPTFRKALALLPGSLFFFQNSLSLATQKKNFSFREKKRKHDLWSLSFFTSTWISIYMVTCFFQLIWNGYKLTLGGCSMFRKINLLVKKKTKSKQI